MTPQERDESVLAPRRRTSPGSSAWIALALLAGLIVLVVWAARETFDYYEVDLNSGAERRQIRMLGVPLRTREIHGPRCDFGGQGADWVHSSAKGVFRRISRTGIHWTLPTNLRLVEQFVRETPAADESIICEIMTLVMKVYFKDDMWYVHVYPEYANGEVGRIMAKDAKDNEYELWPSPIDPDW